MSHWGKRPRDKDDETFVRFSDLSQEKKMERRREEREEKKERERTLSYFKSVDRALGDAADVSMLTAIVDGFFVELMKLLKADSTFHLLRNGLICKVIEKALASAPLLHSKSLLYVFIGHLSDIVSSPVASYLLETLMASISQSLSALEEGDFETEMIPDGPGIHTGSGVPSAMTLVGSVTEELGEYAEDLLTHEVASRATRSILLVLGGFTIRGAPALPRQVRFSEPLDQLTQFLVKALETGYQTTYQLETPGEAWYAAAKDSSQPGDSEPTSRVGAGDKGVRVSVRAASLA
ncbi:hypothetical protein AGDE_13927 [Angomonas deanei]|uniref:Uncharacterized protein n=1 Tax=Angomonas deanei TaxID=59799 RepID=A0A7G2CRT2_9TRYP|nr:hypothetical protein AGDE_13927 [Angomonas deanei]CAD2220892.1 hypothetical protein, conserved [Angomonas deanei]|eukprot:EPY21631.1 hypothetical protein AGDE_13927 [Angomonas deanei]